VNDSRVRSSLSLNLGAEAHVVSRTALQIFNCAKIASTDGTSCTYYHLYWLTTSTECRRIRWKAVHGCRAFSRMLRERQCEDEADPIRCYTFLIYPVGFPALVAYILLPQVRYRSIGATLLRGTSSSRRVSPRYYHCHADPKERYMTARQRAWGHAGDKPSTLRIPVRCIQLCDAASTALFPREAIVETSTALQRAFHSDIHTHRLCIWR
jgi:hypothetical protein